MRRRWIQINGELIEVTRDYQQPSPDSAKNAGVLWNDREYQDMGDSRFTSRSQHKEYMKAKGITTADDFSGEWKKKEALRLRQKEGYDPTRREDLERALSTLSKG